MRAEDLVFWIDVLPDPLEDGAGVLCLRHADSMVVPRGWTLDDLRDPDLHLFRPPLPAPTLRTRSPRPPRGHATGEQLRLGDGPDSTPEPEAEAQAEPAVEPEPEAELAPAADPEPEAASGADGAPWTPSFDEADDLDGLLSARSPLLSRAFRTAERSGE
jgi:hypothetical protein